MTPEEREARIRTFMEEVWNKHELGPVDEMMSPDIIRHDPPWPDRVGLEAYKKWLTDTFASYPDCRQVVEGIVVSPDGNTWSLRGYFQGTQTGISPTTGLPGGGKVITIRWCSMSRAVGDKSVEEWACLDWLGTLRQLGYTFVPPEAQK